MNQNLIPLCKENNFSWIPIPFLRPPVILHFPAPLAVLLGPVTKVMWNMKGSDACHFTLPHAVLHSLFPPVCQMNVDTQGEASAEEGRTSGGLGSRMTAWSRVLHTPCW